MQNFQMCASDECIGFNKLDLIVFKLQMYQFVEMLERIRINGFQIILRHVQMLQRGNGSKKLIGNVAYVIHGEIQLQEAGVVFECIFMKAGYRVSTQIQDVQGLERPVRPCFNNC